MKRHCYNSLGAFYKDVTNDVNAKYFPIKQADDRSNFYGLSLAQVKKSQFSYAVGVEKIEQFKDVAVEKDITVKFWNQFDGFDIDVERMWDNLDFLLDNRKKRSLPKTVDVYINIGEGFMVHYDDLLCKTYAAIKIVDRLETLGVRCAVYACASFKPMYNGSKQGEDTYIEISVKQYADTLNMGALCTAISPWMLRYWFILFIAGKDANVSPEQGIAIAIPMPKDTTGIIIETGACLDKRTANKFIESIKV
jgi:hypothetical protein